MAVPTRTEALSLLLSTSPSPRLLQHVTVVAEVAAFLACRANGAGITVDRRLAETAALLHDVDKALPREHPLRSLGHGARPGVFLELYYQEGKLLAALRKLFPVKPEEPEF